MPEYLYQHPKSGKTISVFQKMTDEHVYFENGVEWKRVWKNPQINTAGTKIDPFSESDFVKKTGAMKGSIGDMIDYSEEMSQRRAEKTGIDPVKRKFFDDYQKENKRKHLLDRESKIENDFLSVDLTAPDSSNDD